MTSDRATFIGGSDAAAVLGLSPWPTSTPLATFMRKRGLVETDPIQDEARDRILRRGKKLEPYVVDTLEEVYGFEITKRSATKDGTTLNRYNDPEHAFLSCEVDFEFRVSEEMAAEYGLDRMLIGTVQNGEVKTHHPRAFFGKYGEAGTDEIPVEYACQALHGQMVTGRRLTCLAAMVGSDDPIIYWVKWDEAVVASMRSRLVKFWHEHVMAGKPPAPVNIEDVWRLFQRKPASVTEATPEVVELVERYKAAQERVKVASEGVDALKFEILVSMLGEEEALAANLKTASQKGRHLLTWAGNELLTVRYQEKTSLDQKGLRKAHPEIALEFEKTSSFYVVAPKRSKK